MELKIGSKIAELRKAKGMTQEQLALALGISAPAVSKWETDNSYPDITLLCPLARALDTNVDTLLEYDEVMTEEKVKAYTNEIIKIERNGDVLLANEKLQKLLCQYPNSVSMKFHAVTLITSFQVMHPECTETQRNEWEKQKKKLLEEIYESKNPAYMNNAISALAVLAIQNNELDRAETLLKQLPENIGDITHFWVQIYLRREVVRNTETPRTLRYIKHEKIIFPYTYDENELVHYDDGEFERLFPGATAYLNEFRDDLDKRQSDNNAKWYEYGRSQKGFEIEFTIGGKI